MRVTFFIISLIFFIYNINCQEIKILNVATGDPIENVAIFNNSQTKSTLSNPDGIADISIFTDNDSLYFQHFSYIRLITTKNNIEENNFKVFLRRKIYLMEEAIVIASGSRELKREVAQKVDVVNSNKILHTSTQTSSDLLISTGNIIIQKSQGGGGSPIIRGFEANKILLVLDGVRMNNAIYRSGHLQNSITIDKSILERVEIIYGPNSVIYGSDALGGVVHYFTRDPELDKDKKLFFGNSYVQYATANNSRVVHTDFNLGFSKIGFLSSLTYNDYGDITAGGYRAPYLNQDYGKRNFYVEKINDNDSIISNSNPRVQKGTGYKQYDFLQKIKWVPKENVNFILNLQLSTSSNVDRYDKLTEFEDNEFTYAEWYYGPQNRFLASLKNNLSIKKSWASEMTTTLAYQRIDEDRISRKYKSNEIRKQKEDVHVYSANIDIVKYLKEKTKINYGFESTFNRVFSNAYNENIFSGIQETVISRYPDDGNRLFSVAGYLNYKFNVRNKSFISLGIRYNYISLHSKFTNNILELSFSEININNGAFTGSASYLYTPREDIKISVIASTGFRNPNIDDYGKIRPKSGYVTVPNNSIKPEYSYNIEFGLSKTFDGYIQINSSFYMTYLSNIIVRQNYSLPGIGDSLYYDNEMYKIITNTNQSEALLHGLSVNVIADVNSNLSFRSTLNYTFGKILSDTIPLSHIPPIFGKTTIKYRVRKFNNEFFIVYNGWKRVEDMSLFGEDNIEQGTENGFPSWYTLNARTTYQINKYFIIQFAIENILDTFYKPFASGVAAPGRNFIVTLRSKF